MTLHSPPENSLAALNHKILEANSQVQNVKLGGHQTCLSTNRLWHELCDMLRHLLIVQFRNEKVNNHGSIPITIDCNVVAFIVFEEEDCGFSFRKIGSRVGRNQTTVMRICDRWIQESTTDRRGRSHPPQCTTSLSARTIRRSLEQSGPSARRQLLGLPLTQNLRRVRRQWCDERRMWAAERNEVVFTDESRICLQHHGSRIRVWRHRGERMLNSCVMHCNTSPALGIMVWGGIEYHSHTPLVRIAGLGRIFQQDNAQPHVARIVQRVFINNQIEFLPWSARSPDLSPIENMWSVVAQQLTQSTPPAAH
ncbi:transposable element Tcb1 transposase [Trichonephila clavipes]|nr:transposable element Tcb1 transposase [Trichonephila clavipes]